MIKVIAEIGCNYIDGLLDSAKKMIEQSKEAGAAYTKFQLFNEKTIKSSPLKNRLKDYILAEEQVKELRAVADATKIGFILTPMYLDAVAIAAKYADLIKIRYTDHKNEELIDKAVETGKELIISVPRRPANAYNPQINFAYCLPSYPPKPEDFNLELATCCEGFSSHFPHTVFDLAFAINRTYKDAFIEKHVMLGIGHRAFFTKDSFASRDGTAEIYFKPEPIDAAVSIGFPELKNFISQLELIERMERIRI